MLQTIPATLYATRRSHSQTPLMADVGPPNIAMQRINTIFHEFVGGTLKDVSIEYGTVESYTTEIFYGGYVVRVSCHPNQFKNGPKIDDVIYYDVSLAHEFTEWDILHQETFGDNADDFAKNIVDAVLRMIEKAKERENEFRECVTRYSSKK